MPDARRNAHVICLGPRGRAKALFLLSVCGQEADDAIPPEGPGKWNLSHYIPTSTIPVMHCFPATDGGSPLAWLEDVDFQPLNRFGQPSREDYRDAAAVFIIFDALDSEGHSQARDILSSVISVWTADIDGTVALVGVREIRSPESDMYLQTESTPEVDRRCIARHVAGAVLPNGEQVLQYQIDIPTTGSSMTDLGLFGVPAARELITDVLDAAWKKRKVDFDPYEL